MSTARRGLGRSVTRDPLRRLNRRLHGRLDSKLHGRLTRRIGRPLTRTLLLTVLATTAACALPRWPVDATMTSDFGLRFRGWSPDLHRGVDLRVSTGTPVVAMAAGYVRFAGVQRGFGNVVWIDHAQGLTSAYAHLSEIRLRRGDRVRTGDLVGLSGASGDVTAPHLHFEVWRWGRPIDPIPVLGGRPASR